MVLFNLFQKMLIEVIMLNPSIRGIVNGWHEVHNI